MKHFVDVKNIRWLGSQDHPLSALICNWRVIFDNLGNTLSGTGGEEAAKAKGFHNKLCSLIFMIWLHVVNNILAQLATLSRAFQSHKLLLYQVPSKIDSTLLTLTAFKSDPAIHMSTFLEKVSI